MSHVQKVDLDEEAYFGTFDKTFSTKPGGCGYYEGESNDE